MLSAHLRGLVLTSATVLPSAISRIAPDHGRITFPLWQYGGVPPGGATALTCSASSLTRIASRHLHSNASIDCVQYPELVLHIYDPDRVLTYSPKLHRGYVDPY